jgi:hypothetical protein
MEISNVEGKRRFAPCINIKKDRACGAPSFDIPCSIFVIRYSKITFCQNIKKFQTEIPTTHYLLPTTYYLPIFYPLLAW